MSDARRTSGTIIISSRHTAGGSNGRVGLPLSAHRDDASPFDADPYVRMARGLLRPGRGLATLAARSLVLRMGPALAALARPGMRLLTPMFGRIGRVCDLGGTLLGHALVLERFVL